MQHPGRELTQEIDRFFQNFKETRPNLKELLKTLRIELRCIGNVFIVVDALDECPERDARRRGTYNRRANLLSSLQELLKSENITILITSRPLPAIQNKLEWPEIPIVAQSSDIGIYLDTQIKTVPRIAGYDQNDLIKNKIINNAQGMSVDSLTSPSLTRMTNMSNDSNQ